LNNEGLGKIRTARRKTRLRLRAMAGEGKISSIPWRPEWAYRPAPTIASSNSRELLPVWREARIFKKNIFWKRCGIGRRRINANFHQD